MPRDTCASLALVPASPLQSQPPPPPPAAGGVLAPGFRFHPTDEELVIYYLKRKVGNKPVRFNAIAEVDIYRNEPWELAAMKKTLVFHSGRAPGGQRTNWVMHEYRLVDEELERIGTLQGDSYVLCRVFHKNNIGPPSGNRYAPFLEEEWDDSRAVLVPGEDAADEVVACNEMNHIQQDKYCITKEAFDVNEVPKETRDLLSLCKNESVEMEDDAPMCVLNTEAPFPLIQYKRRKHGHDYDSNGSEKSMTRTTQDLCSSTTTTATTTTNTTDTMMTTTAATTTAVSALLEFSLMEPKERTPPPPSSPKEPAFTPASLESLVPSGCMKFINDLQREVHKVSVERETLKMEVMSAQAMIYILQTRIDALNKENGDLKRSLGEGK
ncbi:NAC domain containing protein 52 [Linum perenne]